MALYTAGVNRSKDLGETGRPVRMLLDKMKPIAESVEIVLPKKAGELETATASDSQAK